MIRIRHLVPRDADFETERSVTQLTHDLGGGFETDVRRIGRGGDFRHPVVAGIDLRRRKMDGFHIAHAWGCEALTAAVLAGAERIAYSPPASPPAFAARGQRQIRWLRAVLENRDFQVVCPTTTLRRAHIERGVPLERCHLIRPGVDFKRIKRRRDQSLRAALGFGEDDRVVLTAGESVRAAAHHYAVWAVSMLHAIDARYRLLIWGPGERAGAVADFAQRFKQPRLLRPAEPSLRRQIEFEELLPAADIVVAPATGAVSTLPIAICMAAALPIVATVTYTLSELLEDRHTALMVRKRAPRLLAQRILDAQADARLQWSISDMARTEAYEYFAASRFLNQWRGVYRQMAAGLPLEVPEQMPGAGLRFHGRA